MTVSTLIGIIRFLIWLIGVVKKAYDELPPEKKKEIHQEYIQWQEAIKNVQDPMGGDLDGP